MSDYPMLISNKLHSFRNFIIQSFYIGMVFHELYFNVFLYIIKTSENERYLNEKCFFLKKSFFR